MTTENAVKRIAKMESYMNEIIDARKRGVNIQKDSDLIKKAVKLSEYMESGIWLSDYTRQEKGEFPRDMKCGVLSEDTLYNLLADIDSEEKERCTNSAPRKKKIKVTILITALLVLITALIAWIWWGNTTLEVNGYTIVSEKLPKEFNGFTIAHLSDLHNEEIKGLLSALTRAEPDIIVITGDIIDGVEMEITLRIAKEITQIAPCYYVTGNHEARIPSETYAILEAGLKDSGITVLHDQKAVIEKDGAAISIIGLDDPAYAESYGKEGAANDSALIKALTNQNSFTILLSHRPELFNIYVESDVDLALSGHAHGGQFRLPFIGGLVAPNQGLFPKYDAGLFTKENTNMIVSRGVGNGTVVPRINNRPEVITVELISSEK